MPAVGEGSASMVSVSARRGTVGRTVLKVSAYSPKNWTINYHCLMQGCMIKYYGCKQFATNGIALYDHDCTWFVPRAICC